MQSSKASREQASAPRTEATPSWLSSARRRNWLWGASLVLLAAAVYLPTLNNGFVWDDDDYVHRNPTLTAPGGLVDIWTRPAATPQYYPLVHTSYWIEQRLWGFDPRGYHVVNLLLHATSAVLVWRLLVRLAVPGAWLAAALFAVHPVCVESVAWVTERKNVLSCALGLGSLLAYLRLAPPDGAPDRRPRRAWLAYCAALVLYVAALLSKTVTASVPAVLLVITWWKRGRITWRDVLPLVPWFAVGLALAMLTVRLEQNQVGASGEEWNLTLVERVLVAGRVLWFYAAKLVWPWPLVFFYPRWTVDAHQAWQYVFPLAAIGVLVALWLGRARLGRGPLAAVLIFAGVLTPALGFVNVYPFRYSYVADHFQYHAMIALLALAAAGLALAAGRLGDRGRWLAPAAAVGLLACLGVVAHGRTHVFKDRATLHADTLRQNPTAWVVPLNLGSLLVGEGKHGEAIPLLRQAADIRRQLADDYPRVTHYRDGLAVFLAQVAAAQKKAGLPAEAEATHQELINIRQQLARDQPQVAEYQDHLAGSYVELGILERDTARPAEAVTLFQQAIALRERLVQEHPEQRDYQDGLAWAYVHRGLAEQALGQPAESMVSFRRAAKIREGLVDADPTNLDARARLAAVEIDLGLAERSSGQVAQAVASFQRAIDLRSELVKQAPAVKAYARDLAWSYIQLALTHQAAGETAQALSAHRRALEIRQELARDRAVTGDEGNELAASLVDVGLLEQELGHMAEAEQALSSAIRIRQQLVGELPDNANYRVGLAAACELLAATCERLQRPSEAIDWRRQAIATYEQLTRDFPHSGDYQAAVATSYAELGTLLRSLGRGEESQAAWTQSIERRQQLSAANPQLADLKHQLASGFVERGGVRLDVSRPADAEADSREAVAIYEMLMRDEPRNAVYWAGLASAYFNLGVAQLLGGRPSEAADTCRKSAEIREAQVRAHDELDDTKLRLETLLAWSYARWGSALQAASHSDEAGVAFDKALRLRAKLIQDDPLNLESQHQAALSCRDLGNLRLAEKRFEEASIFFRAAVEIREQLCKANPKDATYRSNLAHDLAASGEALAAMSRWSEAAAAFQQAVARGATSPDALWRCALLQLAAGDGAGYRATCARLSGKGISPTAGDTAIPWLVSLILGELPPDGRQAVYELAEQARQAHPAPATDALAAAAAVRAKPSPQSVAQLDAALSALDQKLPAASAADYLVQLAGRFVLVQAVRGQGDPKSLDGEIRALTSLVDTAAPERSGSQAQPDWIVPLVKHIARRDVPELAVSAAAAP